MTQTASVWLVLVVAIVFANLPFVNERLLLVWPRPGGIKSVWWRLLELNLYCTWTLLLGAKLESSIGQRAPQGWEFYAAFCCLFLTLASPGFVWRYLRRGRPEANHDD